MTTGAAPHLDPEVRTVLRVRSLRKSFRHGVPPRRRSIEVLKGADLEIDSGEIVGLVGENGSGKSRLIQIVVGLVGRDEGEIERPGKLGYCPQTPMVWGKLTVSEHFQLFAPAYNLSIKTAGAAERNLLDELQFERYRDYRAQDLSGGTRQKLNLAVALIHEPELLLLDEPERGRALLAAVAAMGITP